MKKYKRYNDYELLYLLVWHSEEALNILLEKYDNLIKIKLSKFKIAQNHYIDYLQELRMSVLLAIRKFDDNYQKSFCRFVELIIERRIGRLLYEDSRSITASCFMEDTIASIHNAEVLDEMIYEARIREVQQIKLDEIKKNILNQVLIRGISVKEYALKYDIPPKDVYNHLYSLRLKVKGKFNL